MFGLAGDAAAQGGRSALGERSRKHCARGHHTAFLGLTNGAGYNAPNAIGFGDTFDVFRGMAVNSPQVPQGQNDSDSAAVKVMAQSRFGTSTEFTLREEDFTYRLKTSGSDRTFNVEYAEISLDRESLTERNPWWRNVGAIWALLGITLMGLRYSEAGVFQLSIWLPVGLLCLAVYYVRKLSFTILPAQRCNVLVIDDAKGSDIVAELERRRAAQLKDRFDFLNPEESPEQQRHRVLWLRRQGSLDDHEVSARMLQIDLMAQSQPEPPRRHDDE